MTDPTIEAIADANRELSAIIGDVAARLAVEGAPAEVRELVDHIKRTHAERGFRVVGA